MPLVAFIFLLQIQALYPLSPTLGSSTFVDSNEVTEFTKANSNLHPLALEEELLFNFYYPQECGCWGDGFYNCVNHTDSASSSLQSNSNFSYSSNNLTDLDLRTAWVEGDNGDGIGERIFFDVQTLAAGGIKVEELVIVNGYAKNRNVWKNNSRVKKMKLYINGIPRAILNLRDVDNYQIFNISRFVDGLAKFNLQLEILEVTKGDKFNDTAITEIFFKGTGCM